MTYERIGMGMTGEDLACRELEQRGYVIIARRYRGKVGEIDIVAKDGATLVFVEVKARASHEFGSAAEAVTPFKQRQVVRVAEEYLVQHRVRECPCRFDVVSIHFDTGAPEIEILKNAFDA
jgi:putative endonuclease